MSPGGIPKPVSHVPALDGLRGVAILLVLLHQLSRIGNQDFASRAIEFALAFGWVGVQLFFVLSGFLITGILLDTRDAPHPLRSFFARRILRIFPLYIGALVLFLWVLPALGLTPVGWTDHQLWYWLYLSNWTQSVAGGSLPHFWSLAVEEQFYLLWPFVVLRFSPRALVWICVAGAAASLAIRTAMVGAGANPESIYMFTTSRIDALLLGAAAAVLLRLPGAAARLPSARTLWAAAALLGLAGLLGTRFQRTGALGQTLGYTVLAVVFASAILAIVLEARSAAGGAVSRVLACAPLRTLGLYSYGMYVLHKPLHDLVGKPVLAALGRPGLLGLWDGLAYVAAGGTAIFAAGALTYWLFERHFLALKERYAPTAAGPPI